MRFSALALLERGLAANDIRVSLERNMQCGIGWCGHCQLGPLLLCRDGPVVGYDVAAPLLRQFLNDHAGQRITLDFSDVTFMDSTAIGLLVAARNRSEAEDGNGAIVLRNVQPMQRQVLSVTGVDDLFEFEDGPTG